MKVNKSYSIWMFIAFLMIQVMGSMPQLGINPILPFIQAELDLTLVQMGYLAATVQFGIAMCSIPAGFLVDYFGVKWVLYFGGFLGGVAAISLYWLDGYAFTLITFLLIGIFYANLHPALSKGILLLVSDRIRGTAMGLKQTGISVSAFIAAVWLPYMATHFHWKTSYLIIGSFLMAISFTALFYRNEENQSNNRIDKARNSLKWSDLVYILQNKTIRVICITTPFLFIAQFTMAAYLMVDVKERFEIPLIQAGYLLAILQFGAILGRILYGLVSDRWFLNRRELLLALVSVATCVIIVSFALIPFKSFMALSIVAFLMGITGSGWVGLFSVIVIEAVEAKYVGLASGITATIGYLSPTIGTPLFGYLHGLFGGFSVPWLLLSGSLIMSAVFLYRLYRLKEKDIESLNCLGNATDDVEPSVRF
jgi:sugar phosphate permease